MRIETRGSMLLLLLVVAAAEGRELGSVPEPGIEWGPRSYACRRVSETPTVDGKLDEPDWQAAEWSDPFVDIEGRSRPEPRFATRVKMLWDDRHFYVAARMDEPHVWASLTDRDAVIYHDNDFEVFIDPDGDTHEYYELEVNALGTEWDLLLVRPYRDGGPAVDAWDIQGLQTAVAVDGTLNDPGDLDTGWTVEIAIPWTVLDDCAHRPSPPKPGDRWRVNFSRVEWRAEVHDGRYVKTVEPATGEPLPEDNWVWSPQGIIAMHYPEMWGFVEFSEAGASDRTPAGEPSPAESAAWILRRIYYLERNFFAEHGRFAGSLGELGPDASWAQPEATVSVTPRGFEASLETSDGSVVHISEDGRVWVED